MRLGLKVTVEIKLLMKTHVAPASVFSIKIQEGNSGGTSLFYDDLYENMGSPQPRKHVFGHHEVEDVVYQCHQWPQTGRN